MALRLKPETREAWKTHLDELDRRGIQWRPVPRAEPAQEKEPSSNTFDIYSKTWVDT